MLTIHAHAKINLGLEILGRRDDGYHEIRTLMTRVALHDTLTLRPAAEVGVRWPAGVLAPQDDLIRRAALLIRQSSPAIKGARISLEKAIPIAGGLGGGSSDAAATLAGLNALWGSPLSTEQLLELGAQLGSDVPFFLAHSPALAEGRGERLTPIMTTAAGWVVIVSPQWETTTKTAALFRILSSADFSDGSRVDAAVRTLESGDFPDIVGFNTFERVIDQVFPEWSLLRESIGDAAGVHFWLSGAGPSLYALAAEKNEAERIDQSIRALGHPSYVTQLVIGEAG